MRSVLQDEKQCYITGRTAGLHKHHIFNASNRKNSEKYGLWVWLIWELHTGDFGIHNGNKELDLQLKQTAQRKFEDTHSRGEFMKIFGRNWL